MGSMLRINVWFAVLVALPSRLSVDGGLSLRKTLSGPDLM